MFKIKLKLKKTPELALKSNTVVMPEHIKGDKGDDYILTEADKTEIAKQAAEFVEIPEVPEGVATEDFVEEYAQPKGDYITAEDLEGIGTGGVSINLNGTEDTGDVVPLNADTLGGVPADEYAKKSDIGMDLLWENASPTSAFYAQSLNLNISNYRFLIVYYNLRTGATKHSKSVIVPVQNATYTLYDVWGANGDAYIQERSFTLNKSNNTVAWTKGTLTHTGDPSDNDGMSIPQMIIGIK